MEFLNEIRLRGRVGTIKVTEVGGTTQVARLTLMTQECFMGGGGATIECTWHTITAWKNAKFPSFDTIKRDTPLYIVGKVRNQHYTTSDGENRYTTEIVAKEISIVKES